MPHGGPDWGTGGKIDTVHTIEDLGELAARLKSVDTFDRRGNVIFLDDFEDGIEKWQHTSVAGGESLEWVSTYARNGGFCVKLATDTTANDDATMERYMPYPSTTKSGIEFSFKHDANLKQIFFGLMIDTGITVLEAAIRWTQATNTWAYEKRGGGYTDLTPVLNLLIETTMFTTVKLVADFATKKYVRLIVNNTIFDLSGLDLYEPGGSIAALQAPFVLIRTNKNAATNLYIDDVIVTQNEP